jgi:glyoxylase-like metal-dependent hydrolase (beta-lactamase superfamily II)
MEPRQVSRPQKEDRVAEGEALARVDILTVGYADSPSVAGTVGLVRDGDRIIVVDPGMVRSRSLILDPIERLGLTPDDVTHVFVSHHHLDHTVNIALFREAEIVDFRSVRRDDQVGTHQGEGFKLGPNTTIWVTPGHTAQDASLVVDTADAREAFTHLWWRADRTPEVDPYCTDPAELARNRQRLLDGVDVVIPGHGAPFRVR